MRRRQVQIRKLAEYYRALAEVEPNERKRRAFQIAARILAGIVEKDESARRRSRLH
jgi:hypothetical protein